ncbi:troponin C-like isoform X1 [Convolutriloba macropyga]|uniref:troponin C-like isoform X1 n=1 Tax=Convolutriloba macropyga TaxID=536237 RepID=UPI003F522191
MVKCIYLFIYLFIESDIHRIIVYKRTFVPKKFSAKTMDEHLHVHTIVENTHGLNAKEALQFREAFDYFNLDSGVPGWLEVRHLKCHLEEMGYNPSEEELVKFYIELDPFCTGQYDFDSFLRMVAIILRSGDEFEKDLSSVFRMFDIQAKGTIATSAIRNILKEVDPGMTEWELEDLIRETDRDQSGEVDFEEFRNMMMTN